MRWSLVWRSLAFVVLGCVLGLVIYSGLGWYDARQDGPDLAKRADELMVAGRGANALGPERVDWLIEVEDPEFYAHQGIDFTSPGAGATTITQSLAKRLAFEAFEPGIGKVRQTGYALGLEQVLSKDQILTLFLETAEMGKGTDDWVVGFFNASHQAFGKEPGDVSRDDFLRLVAVLVAPSKLRLFDPNAVLDDRVARIDRLLKKDCLPLSHGDVWLSGCR